LTVVILTTFVLQTRFI